MRRRPVWLLAYLLVISLAALTGWNRTAADDRPDQSIDFRLSQIMVKLNQIEWELSQVRSRLASQDQQLDDIDRQLERILEEIEEVTSTASTASTTSSSSASSRAAIDPALVGTWRLARNDFAENIPSKFRRYLEEQAEQAEERWRREYRRNRIDERVEKFIDGFEDILDQAGFLLIHFSRDGEYTDGTGDKGMWLVSGDRLILTTFDGRAHPSKYSVDGTNLAVTLTGDQIGTLFSLEAESAVRRYIGNHRQYLKYTDRVHLFYTKDF